MIVFGKPTLRHAVVDSTQNVAKALVQSGATPGTTVTAEAMTAGRGRRGRAWHVPPGANVCLTTIGPSVPPDAAWQIAFVAAVAVAGAVPGGRVRYPNDILLGGKKVSGVLVEMAENVPLIGIGVNVVAAPLPPDLADRATSIEAATGRAVSVAEIEMGVLTQLSAVWEAWTRDGFAAIAARWNDLADPVARRNFILNGETVACRVVDLAPDGTTTLETPTGARHTIPAAAVLLDN